MDMIRASDVISRVETYFGGGMLKYLSRPEQRAAARGLKASKRNGYDQQPLTIHNAGMSCDRFSKQIQPYPEYQFRGRGIVVCGGGVRYFTNAWLCINMLRHLGCSLPIQFWYLGQKEMSSQMCALLHSLDVQCVDALLMREIFPARILNGWELKPYAILHSSFSEVLFLDADNVPVVDPAFLFETRQYRSTGAVFWPDYDHPNNQKKKAVWRSCGLRQPNEPEFESGQMLFDKRRCWRALSLAMWFNENSDFYHQYVYGDKETFHLAFRKMRTRYSLVPKPIHTIQDTMCQHDFDGRRIFQHRNSDKWDFHLENERVKDFLFEDECRSFLNQLRRLWDGNISPHNPEAVGQRSQSLSGRRMRLQA
jgi:hypothetical protein